jgi:hypothetical protein
MTIHWKAIEEHFLMVPLVFQFNRLWGDALSQSSTAKQLVCRKHWWQCVFLCQTSVPNGWSYVYRGINFEARHQCVWFFWGGGGPVQRKTKNFVYFWLQLILRWLLICTDFDIDRYFSFYGHALVRKKIGDWLCQTMGCNSMEYVVHYLHKRILCLSGHSSVLFILEPIPSQKKMYRWDLPICDVPIQSLVFYLH